MAFSINQFFCETHKMELHEDHSHHASTNLMLGLVKDKYGQLKPIRGQGYRHGSIYEQISDRAGQTKQMWIEDANGNVVMRANRKHTLDDLVRLRNDCLRDCTVVVYSGEYHHQRRIDDPEWGNGFPCAGRTVYPPKNVSLTKCETHKKNKVSKKIKRVFK